MIKIGIISLTNGGAILGQRVKESLLASEGKYEIETFEKIGRESGAPTQRFEKIASLVIDLFKSYDRLLFIMSTGIVVRVISPLLIHKSQDPAVLVMDEAGNHVISLLSGHLGGANEWALEIGQLIGADPVITTATDVKGIPAPDILARKCHFKIENFQDLVEINAALVAGKSISYFIDEDLYHKNAYIEACKDYGVEAYSIVLPLRQGDTQLEELMQSHYKVCITDKICDLPGRTLFLRPPTLVAGIGCRRGTAKEMIQEALIASLKEQRRSFKSLIGIASVIVKANEEGLLAAVNEWRLPITFYTQEEMAPFIEEAALEESNFVKNTIGVGNVCETTCMLLGKSKELVQKKTIYPKITVALAKANWSLSELAQAIQKK